MELRFAKGQNLKQLGPILRQGYENGQRPVRVAFEDSHLPACISLGAILRTRKGSLNLGARVLDLIGSEGLPTGILKAERETRYNNGKPVTIYYLVYEPVP